MMQSKANTHDHRFLRYKQFSVWWLLIGWSLGEFLRCWGLPSIIGKVFLRAFQCNLDRWKRPIIYGDTSEWNLWHIWPSKYMLHSILYSILPQLLSVPSTFFTSSSLSSFSILNPCSFANSLLIDIPVAPLSNNTLTVASLCVSNFSNPTFIHTYLRGYKVRLTFLIPSVLLFRPYDAANKICAQGKKGKEERLRYILPNFCNIYLNYQNKPLHRMMFPWHLGVIPYQGNHSTTPYCIVQFSSTLYLLEDRQEPTALCFLLKPLLAPLS